MNVSRLSGQSEMPSYKEFELANLLTQHTREKHLQIEKSLFSQKLVDGDLSKTEYVMYLADLYAIYSLLEEQLVGVQDNFLKVFADKIKYLFRVNALKQDMAYFHVPVCAAGSAAKEYQKRLWSIGHQKPFLLVAHAWVRYMGDLFGGQISKDKFEEKWPEGIEFFQYDELLRQRAISKPTQFARSFRELLNQLNLTEKQVQEVIDEAIWSFDQHVKIFDELMRPSYTRMIYAWAVPLIIKWDPRNCFQAHKE